MSTTGDRSPSWVSGQSDVSSRNWTMTAGLQDSITGDR